MISWQLIDILRCPLDPQHSQLEQVDKHLVCSRCSLKFPIKDGFPCLVVQEAELPPECESLSDLPCQRR